MAKNKPKKISKYKLRNKVILKKKVIILKKSIYKTINKMVDKINIIYYAIIKTKKLLIILLLDLSYQFF